MNWQKFYASDAIVYGLKTTVDNIRVAIYSIAIILCEVLASIFIVGLPTLIFALWKMPELRTLASQIRTAATSFSYSSMQTIFQNNPLPPMLLSVKIALVLAICALVILWSMFAAGYIRMVIKFHDTGIANLREMFMGWHRGPRLLLGNIILLTASAIGFLFFVIPGIYILVHGALFQFFIIDKNVGPIEALKRSFSAIRGYSWQIGALMLFLAMISLNPICMGLAIFTKILMNVHAYRRLTA